MSDITSGIQRIAALLEARQNLGIQEDLDDSFEKYQKKYKPLEAVAKSFEETRLHLSENVQETYLEQGVEISSKHVELVVKEMTSKVMVTDSGDTEFIPGDILKFSKAEMMEKSFLLDSKKLPTYKPLVLGLTKATLNSDSFLVAAGFERTTQILTDAAIEGKKDWIKGIKENAILGRLIPVGTGFKLKR
jgi:DNA-directed RNA polymerase subunit beta'